MKKFFSVAIVAAVVATMMSCGNNPKPSLKNDVDTLSYAIGVVQSQGLMDYLANAKGVDTTYIAEFLQGVNDGAKAGDDKWVPSTAVNAPRESVIVFRFTM